MHNGKSPLYFMLRVVDLFAGTGAFSLAFEQTGKAITVFANDMVETSKQIYDANFENELTLRNLHDIANTDIPEHDILTGGFPCQPFSIAGKRNGFADERANVFWKILSIIDDKKPKCVLLENVKNIVTHDEGRTFAKIQIELEQRGYHIMHKVLNTAKITGIPQHRERIYIVCMKSKTAINKFNFDFPTEGGLLCLPNMPKRELAEFLEDVVAEKYYYKNTSGIYGLLTRDVTKRNTVYQFRRVYVRENKSGECPTLTANMGSGGHNVPIILDERGIRKLTPRECFNLQGFPQTYVIPNFADSHAYKLAGNAVSLPVVKMIAERVVMILQEDEQANGQNNK